MSPLPDDALVVRGGSNTPGSFAGGSGVVLDDQGRLQQVSVNAGAGMSVDQLTAGDPKTGYPGIPHTQVGVTTVRSIRRRRGRPVADEAESESRNPDRTDAGPGVSPVPADRAQPQSGAQAEGRNTMKPRLYADFHSLDDENRVRLDAVGTVADLARRGLQLADGLQLTLWTEDADESGRPDDLLVDCVVRHGAGGQWVAEADC